MNMKRQILVLCLLILAVLNGWSKNVTYTVSSPDRNYNFTFYQEEIKPGVSRMYYTLSYKGKSLIGKSEMGVRIDNKLQENALAIPNDHCEEWGDNLVFLGADSSTVKNTWEPLYGENAMIPDNYCSLNLKFRKGELPDESKHTDGYNKQRTYFMNVEVRAYNEGVAFRYHFPVTSNGLFLHITDELTQFRMPEGTIAYAQKWAQSPTEQIPLAQLTYECERPLTMQTPDGLTVSLGEGGMVDYVRTKFKPDTTAPDALRTSMYGCADIITPYNTPWRIIMAAERPVDLIAHNNIYLNLNEPCALKGDLSYIRPGKVFRCSLTQKDAMEGVDFAAERGLQYIHLDAGWYGPEMFMSSDATRVSETKDLDFKALCDYAATKGIGVWVYVNQRALITQLDQMLPTYKKWGIKGIKFGFVQIGNQFWSVWLHHAVKKCADYGFMVDVHDEYRPTGVSRTLPNLMTQEGIHGNEEMPNAEQNTIQPFTRFLCGPADYTPCYFNNRVKNTFAHQLAMPVVYYSPITFLFWYDKPNLYKGEKELDFWKDVPTVWDETYPIDGQIGEYVAIARRSGSTWFVGVMNGLEARELTLPTDFLQKGKKYTVTLYEDCPELKTRTKVGIREITVKGGKPIHLKLQGSGGAAIKIVEK